MKKRASSTGRILAALAILTGVGAAHAQQQLWGTQVGTPSNEMFIDAVPDGVGGTFVCGDTEGQLGDAQFGGRDCVVARFDAQGNQSWLTQYGTDQFDWSFRIAFDGENGVYVVGRTEGVLEDENYGLRDAYVAKLEADTGDIAWFRQFGTPGQENLRGLITDGAGGVFVAGVTEGVLGDKSFGLRDAVLARFDSGGVMSWLVQFGSTELDTAYALAPDGAGGVFVGGNTEGDLGGPNMGGRDVYLAHFDASGAQIGEAVQLGGPLADYLLDLEPDGEGGTIACGILDGLGVESDGWVRRFGPDLSLIREMEVGSDQYDELVGILPLGGDEIVVVGSTMGAVGEAFGGLDVLVARYAPMDEATWEPVWIEQFGTVTDEAARAVCADGAGGAYVVGSTHGDLFGEVLGNADAFIVRFGCPADMNGDGELNILDFVAFQQLWQAQDQAADCDGSKSFNILDFVCYQGAFLAGCP